ncbi:MAG: flagellar assembly protein FliW [Bacillota bacterium]|jgi:flagellar assembly factor FliW|nr:flagellar assembly protein FliW [Bacillota bacterium]HOB91495.1 flagellar assembly protein FliW [Bacillota bacterium]HPZ54649.1 flagellar assembly protein FliW [Bacillota bacterium]HQD18915.1 flagellar assembly protein FliW [Bacillota bacterium]
MLVANTRFGDLEISEEQIIYFPKGIIGFEGLERYVLLNATDKVSWLQSVDEPALAFPVVQAPLVYPGYSLYVEDDILSPLGEVDESLMGIYLVLVVPRDPSAATVNLKAPIVISFKSRRGMQLLVDRPEYSMRHRVVAAKKGA